MSQGRESICDSGVPGDAISIPGSGRSPGGGHDNLLQYSCLEKPLNREALWATVLRVTKSPQSCKELDTTEST